jgi:inner membrane protein
MPSPVGHALGGMIAGWGAAGRRPWPAWVRQAIVFAVVGILPDLDLLFGAHSGPTHSVGAAAIVAVMAWGLSGFRARPAVVIAIFAAYGSHIFLDWLADDTSPPLGIMALWPFSHEYFMSPVAVMPAISRRYWLPGFWGHNLRALLFEIVVLLPIAALVWWGRGYLRRR